MGCIRLLLLYHIAAYLSIGLECKVCVKLYILAEDGRRDSILLYHCWRELSIGVECKIIIKLGVLARLCDKLSVPLYHFFAALSMGFDYKMCIKLYILHRKNKKAGLSPCRSSLQVVNTYQPVFIDQLAPLLTVGDVERVCETRLNVNNAVVIRVNRPEVQPNVQAVLAQASSGTRVLAKLRAHLERLAVIQAVQSDERVADDLGFVHFENVDRVQIVAGVEVELLAVEIDLVLAVLHGVFSSHGRWMLGGLSLALIT